MHHPRLSALVLSLLTIVACGDGESPGGAADTNGASNNDDSASNNDDGASNNGDDASNNGTSSNNDPVTSNNDDGSNNSVNNAPPCTDPCDVEGALRCGTGRIEVCAPSGEGCLNWEMEQRCVGAPCEFNAEGDPSCPPPCLFEDLDGRLLPPDGNPMVQEDPDCGRLGYALYAARGEEQPTHRLPDFSFAGYEGGGVAIPDVPTVLTLDPAPGDARARIQAALDEVGAMEPDADGFRGAVLLRRGRWDVGDTLQVTHSGVVLRGEGQGEGGTVLVATRAAQHDLIEVRGEGSGVQEAEGSRVEITHDAPVGFRALRVTSGAGFSAGDTVAVLRTPNQAWLDALGMEPYGWTTSSYTIAHRRTVTSHADRRVTVDVPLVDAIDLDFGGGAVFKAALPGRVHHAGVEDLRLESAYQGDEDEEHGWYAVTLRRATNSWVRRVTAVHFGMGAVHITRESDYNTVEEVAQLDPVSQIRGGRRYSFHVSDGLGNLFQRCFARGGRHNFVTGSRVTGPNVWLDSLSIDNHSDEGPHHRWATGLLFDNTRSEEFNVQNRQDSGTGHGWAGAQTLFWNIVATGSIRADAPTGSMNWAIGAAGPRAEGRWAPDEPFGHWESRGEPVAPRSLYLTQLQDRLGPEAVAATTHPAQRQGTIWHLLRAWAGEGRMSDLEAPYLTCEGLGGVGASDGCCAASCGTCGGSGCSQRPGGAEACCNRSIREAGVSCVDGGPPCLMP